LSEVSRSSERSSGSAKRTFGAPIVESYGESLTTGTAIKSIGFPPGVVEGIFYPAAASRWGLGAKIVGVPSGQSGNHFGNSQQFVLKIDDPQLDVPYRDEVVGRTAENIPGAIQIFENEVRCIETFDDRAGIAGLQRRGPDWIHELDPPRHHCPNECRPRPTGMVVRPMGT